MSINLKLRLGHGTPFLFISGGLSHMSDLATEVAGKSGFELMGLV